VIVEPLDTKLTNVSRVISDGCEASVGCATGHTFSTWVFSVLHFLRATLPKNSQLHFAAPMRSEGSHRVYVGNLPEFTSESDLKRHFEKAGYITGVTMKTNYAFIDFERFSDFEYAIQHFNRTDFQRKRITVEEAKGTPRDSGRGFHSGGSPPRGGFDRFRNSNPSSSFSSRPLNRKLSYRVLVMNVPVECKWSDLKDFMKKAGEVNYTSTHDPVHTVGIVEFERSKHIKRAVQELDNTKLMGHTIRILDPKSFTMIDKMTDSSPTNVSLKSIDRYSKSRSRSPKSRSAVRKDDRDRTYSRERSYESTEDRRSRSRSGGRHAGKRPHSQEKSINGAGSPTKQAKYDSKSLSRTPDRED